MSATSPPSSSAIKIFCRIKPVNDPVSYDIHTIEDGDEERLELHLDPNAAVQYLNNKQDQFQFRFSKVFDRSSRQDYVFGEVARPVIDSAFLGYNATIFAYGQTGTGKTFTMTGSRASYHDRGIIPRTLEYIFEKFGPDNNPAKVRNVFVSYLEIYNEAGYDLLNPTPITGRMDDMGRVTIMEDGSHQMHLRNLSVNSVANVQEAIQLLYLGDHNRTIAETPMNETSTRSHCIFTIHLCIRDVNTSLTTRSKLNLVDLAGSERVSTISTTSHLATEARHINLALHYLEQVIVALGESNRNHIPYRNSMMTAVLRDSLGGNCMTSMIATVSLDLKNSQESLSTCRFAQRVALVRNVAKKNEGLDPNIIITQLKNEVKRLREIIESNSISNVKESTGPLTDDELDACSYGVQQFLANSDMRAGLAIPADMRMVQECFRILKRQVTYKANSPSSSDAALRSPVTRGPEEPASDQPQDFTQMLARRDAEIRVLTDMIRREKTKRSQTAVPASPKLSDESIPVSGKQRPSTTSRSEGSGKQLISPRGLMLDKQDVLARLALLAPPGDGNRFDDTPGVLPGGHKNRLDCDTPPPSRDDPTFDGNAMTRHFSEAKRIALVTYINKYEGAPAVQNLRAKGFQIRAEIRDLDASIASSKQNIESMKKIAETTGDPETKCNLSVSMNNQQRTVDLNSDRRQTLAEEVEGIEVTLKAEYKKLLAGFEEWWDVTQKIGPIQGMVLPTQKDIVPQDTVGEVVKKSGEEERRVMGGGQGQTPVTSSRREAVPNILVPPDETDDKSKLNSSPTSPMLPPRAPIKTRLDLATGGNQSESDSDDSPEEEQGQRSGSRIPVTGDTETDQEVLQFLQARKQVFQAIKMKKEEIGK